MSSPPLSRPQQVCVLLRGYPGVGKTTLARALATATGFVLILKDDVRGPTLANDIRVRAALVADAGTCPDLAIKLVDSNAVCYHVMNALAATQLSVGAAGVILESPLGHKHVAKEAVQVATAAGARCLLVDCVLDLEIWRRRLADRRSFSVSCGMPNSPHAVAHSSLPEDAQQILKHYPDGMSFLIEHCDAVIKVDCARPVQEGVRTVFDTIRNLQDTTNTLK